MENELRKKLTDLSFVVSGAAATGLLPQHAIKGAEFILSKMDKWLSEVGDGWHDLPDDPPMHNKYVHLIVQKNTARRWIIIAWFDKSKSGGTWIAQGNKTIHPENYRLFAWHERNSPPEIPERLKNE